MINNNIIITQLGEDNKWILHKFFIVPRLTSPLKDVHLFTEEQGRRQARLIMYITKERLVTNMIEGVDTMQKWLNLSFAQNSERDCLGTFDHETNTYVFNKYKDVFQAARAIGTNLIIKNLILTITDSQGITIRPIGLYSKNRAEWTFVDVACQLYGLTSIAFYDTLGPQSINYGITLTQCSTCFCQASTAIHLANSENLSYLKTVITFDDLPVETAQLLTNKGITILNFKDLLICDQILPFPEDVKPSTPLTICFTSGTTGNPKGVVQSHGNYVALNSSRNSVQLGEKDFYLSYLPLPHVYERTLFSRALVDGLSICFYTGNILNLRDDILRAKPTILASVPRIYNRYYDAITKMVESFPEEKRKEFQEAVKIKLEIYKTTGITTHEILDNTVFAVTRSLFGGRQKLLVTAAAPIASDVLDFLKVVLCCPIMECYGQTESTGGGFQTDPEDKLSGHLGSLTAIMEMKLEDIPEMEYLSTDMDANGVPTPRGEVCFRGPSIMLGYFGQPDLTKEAIDQNGWLHTGDVGVVLPNGSLRLIDRKKNLFKLAQAEYVSPERVENIYVRVPVVLECFVYGDSLKSYCVGVIVPDQVTLSDIAQSLNITGSFEDLCKNSQIRKHILQLVNAEGLKEKLNGYEQIKNVYLEPKAFGLLGILTDTQKMQRFVARKHYEEILQSLYQESGDL